MSNNILCLWRSYGSYAVRNNYIAKFRSPTTSCAQYCQLSWMQSSHSANIRSAIALSRHSSSSSSNSISATPNEHLNGIQKDRERAAAMLTAASGGSQSTNPPIRTIIQNGQSLVKDKVNSVYQYIDRFSRTNEIREAHEHVERLQEELIEIQQKRREVANKMTDIRYDIQMLYGELSNCQKGEPRYLDLVRKEYEVSANAIEPLPLIRRTFKTDLRFHRFITRRNKGSKNLIYLIKPNGTSSFIYKPL